MMSANLIRKATKKLLGWKQKLHLMEIGLIPMEELPPTGYAAILNAESSANSRKSDREGSSKRGGSKYGNGGLCLDGEFDSDFDEKDLESSFLLDSLSFATGEDDTSHDINPENQEGKVPRK